MLFEELVGQIAAKTYLKSALQEKRLPNTLLFHGPQGVGKQKAALLLAKELLQANPENHPDFHSLIPEGKSGLHLVETIRSAIDTSHESSFLGFSKVFLIHAAEQMQPAAANALLKTLEEPVLDSYWILISSQPQEILPTIISRCVQVPFFALRESEVASVLRTLNLPLNLATLAEGSPGKAQELAAHPELAEARKILWQILAERPFYPHLFAAFQKLEELLEEEEGPSRGDVVFSWIALYFREQLRSGTELGEWEEPLEEARLAYARNIKLATCLESFFLKYFIEYFIISK